MAQADRILLLVDGARGIPAAPLPAPTDVVLLGGPVDEDTRRAIDALDPRATCRVASGERRKADVASIARRLTGRSVGLVLSGGGARGFCHVGVLEALSEAQVTIDRIAGTSMGAFVGALAAGGLSPEEVDAVCYEEWVRRSPLSDYRLPRTSLIRGERVRAMLERRLPGAIEDLPTSYSCMVVDLISAEAIRVVRGRLSTAVAASMALPIIAPPVVLGQQLLMDGGLLDNFPTELMAGDGEGPIIGSDAAEPSVRKLPDGVVPQVPSLPETLFKIMLLGESNAERRKSFADLYIRPDFDGTGVLEFHMLDRMRAAGRTAALAALEQAPPEFWG